LAKHLSDVGAVYIRNASEFLEGSARFEEAAEPAVGNLVVDRPENLLDELNASRSEVEAEVELLLRMGYGRLRQ
jgi:hypothetical protein